MLRRPQFQACYDEGRKLFTKRFVLFIKPRPVDDTGVRLGLTVSRKVGCAVVRNRIKRLLREYFRLQQNDFYAPVDIVIVPKRKFNVRGLDLSAVADDITPALNKYLSSLDIEAVVE